MESWGRLKRCNPSNRSDPCDSPRTDLLQGKRCRSPSNKDRTHDLSTVDPHVRCGDPAGLRRPEIGASGVERREEQHFEVWWRLDLREKRDGQPYGTIMCHLGVAPPPLFI